MEEHTNSVRCGNIHTNHSHLFCSPTTHTALIQVDAICSKELDHGCGKVCEQLHRLKFT